MILTCVLLFPVVFGFKSWYTYFILWPFFHPDPNLERCLVHPKSIGFHPRFGRFYQFYKSNSPKLTARTWKCTVGRPCSFWDGVFFRGELLVGRVFLPHVPSPFPRFPHTPIRWDVAKSHISHFLPLSPLNSWRGNQEESSGYAHFWWHYFGWTNRIFLANEKIAFKYL